MTRWRSLAPNPFTDNNIHAVIVITETKTLAVRLTAWHVSLSLLIELRFLCRPKVFGLLSLGVCLTGGKMCNAKLTQQLPHSKTLLTDLPQQRTNIHDYTLLLRRLKTRLFKEIDPTSLIVSELMLKQSDDIGCTTSVLK
jgi:hypothetical protein